MFVLEQIKTYAKTDRTALINRDESLSFSGLDAQSEAFATWLLSQFNGDRTPILIYGHKETAFLPCIYGALKAGRAYIPIDLVVPVERVSEIILDTKPKVIIDFSGKLKAESSIILTADILSGILSAPIKADVSKDFWVRGEDTAYILFTSGSTGKPKGVPITVNNLNNFYSEFSPYLKEEGGVILNQISYSFDVSVCSVFSGISSGMTLFTIDQEMVDNPKSMFDSLKKSGLTTWVSTPSFGELCVQSKLFSSEYMPNLNKFIFCGEVLTHKLCDQLAQRFPTASVVNTYGPTEATVLVTAAEITAQMREDTRPIPIGYPLDEVVFRIVSKTGGTVTQEEESGELLIISDSVGLGYYGRPDLTKDRFFIDTATGKRGYRSGDICYCKDGLYYYQGRVDNQLKLQGHRIEIEDIENNLVKVANIARAAVIPVWEEEKVQYLAAFLMLEEPDNLTPLKRSMAIKKMAAEHLPSYMIPRKLIFVDQFPLNTNGKIDKKELASRLEAVVK